MLASFLASNIAVNERQSRSCVRVGFEGDDEVGKEKVVNDNLFKGTQRLPGLMREIKGLRQDCRYYCTKGAVVSGCSFKFGAGVGCGGASR